MTSVVRSRLLNLLRSNRGGVVVDDELVSYSGIKSVDTLAHHVSKLRDLGHVIARKQEQGYVYQGRVNRPSTSEEATIGETWRPDHVGDPLLDALIRVHGCDRVQRDVVA